MNLGEQDELKLDVNVTNLGEPAYEAQLFIEHSNTLNYIAIDDKFVSIPPRGVTNTPQNPDDV